MIRWGLAGLLGLCVLLAVTIALELTGGVADDGGMTFPPPRPAPAPPSRAAALPVLEQDRQALVEDILADLDNEKMAELNAQVDVEGMPAEQVAESYLEEIGVL